MYGKLLEHVQQYSPRDILTISRFGFDFSREVLSKFVETNDESDATKNAQENVENDVTICCEDKEQREMGK